MLKLFKKRTQNISQKDAEKIYKKQLQAIQYLAKQEGFGEIVKYWERVYMEADELIDAKGVDDSIRQEAIRERRIIKRHLTWLYNLSK